MSTFPISSSALLPMLFAAESSYKRMLAGMPQEPSNSKLADCYSAVKHGYVVEHGEKMKATEEDVREGAAILSECVRRDAVKGALDRVDWWFATAKTLPADTLGIFIQMDLEDVVLLTSPDLSIPTH